MKRQMLCLWYQCLIFRGNKMYCSKCAGKINELNHFYVPVKGRKDGMRICVKCAREEKIVTLV